MTPQEMFNDFERDYSYIWYGNPDNHKNTKAIISFYPKANFSKTREQWTDITTITGETLQQAFDKVFAYLYEKN